MRLLGLLTTPALGADSDESFNYLCSSCYLYAQNNNIYQALFYKKCFQMQIIQDSIACVLGDGASKLTVVFKHRGGINMVADLILYKISVQSTKC